jgi:hypothetical protein
MTHESFAESLYAVVDVHAVRDHSAAIECWRQGYEWQCFRLTRHGIWVGAIISRLQPGVLTYDIEAVKLVKYVW